MSIILLFISITFLFVNNFNQWTGISLPQEQVLGSAISWNTSLNTVTSNFKNAFLGSGTGTWHYVFSKFKPIEFNNSVLWQIRFDRAGNYITELIATSGILGSASYLLMIVMFFLVFWVFILLFPYLVDPLTPHLGQIINFSFIFNLVVTFLFCLT